jgi:ATP-dependent exoDNAse (exonuclease V) beta subunit
MDVLYLTDGMWTVVDYKTDRLRDELALRSLPEMEKYRAQVRGYGQAIEQLAGHRPRLILLFLNYSGRVDGIHQEFVEIDQ